MKNNKNLISALTKIVSKPRTMTKTIIVDYNNEEIEVDVTAIISFDPNYGADADGRRGVPRVFVDDMEFEIFDEKELNLSKEEKDEILKLAKEESKHIDWY